MEFLKKSKSTLLVNADPMLMPTDNSYHRRQQSHTESADERDNDIRCEIRK